MNIYVYFILVTQFLNFACANEERNLNLPIIYNFEEQCLPLSDQSLTTCPSKVWLVIKGLLLNQHEIAVTKRTSDINDCFKMCLNMSSCTAVLRSHWYTDSCWFYDKIKDNHDHDINYNTFVLKCCELKKEKISDLMEPNYPIVFWTTYLLEHEFYNEKNRCKNYVWLIKEKRNLDDTFLYKTIKLENAIDCMNQCVKEKICSAIRTHIDEFNPLCYLYINTTQARQTGVNQSTVYLLGCAKIDEQVLQRKKIFSDIPTLYEPTKVCKRVSTIHVRECEGKIWHAEDGVRINGHYMNETNVWISSCQNKCGEDQECQGISFDWVNYKCFHLNDAKSSRYYRQFHWTTYTLKCCNEFKNDDYNKDSFLQSSDDSIEFPSYPIISNIAEDCLAEENQHIETCATKAWLAVDNLYIKRNPHKSETNVLSCFQHCLDSNRCKGITIQKSKKEFCWTENQGQFINGTSKKFKSFFLTCCALKNKETVTENEKSDLEKSNFPIVFDPQINCKVTNPFAVSCKNPTWHMQESTTLTISSTDELTNTNTMDLLNECAKNVLCKAISVEEVSPFVTVFRQYENNIDNDEKSKTNAKTTIVYEKVCCNSPLEIKWKSNNPDLIMITKPITNCKIISLADVDCPVKVWHMRDGVRLKGHYEIIPLESVQNCLRHCFKTLPCKGVSVDLYQRRCLLFGGTGFREYFNQPQWVSYLMKCCYDVEIQL